MRRVRLSTSCSGSGFVPVLSSCKLVARSGAGGRPSCWQSWRLEWPYVRYIIFSITGGYNMNKWLHVPMSAQASLGKLCILQTEYIRF